MAQIWGKMWENVKKEHIPTLLEWICIHTAGQRKTRPDPQKCDAKKKKINKGKKTQINEKNNATNDTKMAGKYGVFSENSGSK
jgi:hypothetical protein